MNQSLGQRIAARRKELKISLEDVAERVGVKYQTIQDLESGKSQGTKHLLAIARALGVRAEWLETGQGGMRDADRDWDAPGRVPKPRDDIVEIEGSEFARLPVYDIRFAAGDGAINDNESPIDHYLISLSLLRAMTDAALDMIGVFQVKGDSMEPTLNNHDWVMVDLRRTKLGNPGIYALVFESEGLLKRVSRHLETGTVTLMSDNPKYEPQLIKKPANLTVVGRVILSIRRH